MEDKIKESHKKDCDCKECSEEIDLSCVKLNKDMEPLF